MNSLILSQRCPLYLTNPSPPWKPNYKPVALLPSNLNKWQPNANAKGFTSRKPPVTEESNLNIKNTHKQTSNDDEEIPKDVFNRIIARVLVSVGIPMALGLAFLNFFGTVREQGLWDVPKWIPFLTTFLTFGASAFGIAYGALSTSLDPNKNGSLLGLEEAQRNWVEMWEDED